MSPIHRFPLPLGVVLSSAVPALAGDVVIEVTGTLVTASASGTSPFAGASAGDAVLVHLEVNVPGTDVAPGQFTNYAIDAAASFVQVGAIVDGVSSGQVGIQNDFPVADGVRCFGAPMAGGGGLTLEVGESSGALFTSTDITMQLGTWGPSTWSAFNFGIFGGGSFLEFSVPTITIELPSVGTSYCGPAPTNSSGGSATIVALGSDSVAANDLVSRASGMPPQSFGYFLASRTPGFVANPGGSHGNLCLSGAIGRYVGPGQIQNSGATGTIEITIDLGAIPQPTGPVAAIPGETWHFQAWFRDAVGGAATSNLTDGVEVLLQ